MNLKEEFQQLVVYPVKTENNENAAYKYVCMLPSMCRKEVSVVPSRLHIDSNFICMNIALVCIATQNILFHRYGNSFAKIR